MSLEDGTVQGFDIRVAKSDSASDLKPSFTLHAHDKAVCTVSYNPSAPNVRKFIFFNLFLVRKNTVSTPFIINVTPIFSLWVKVVLLNTLGKC